MGLIYPGFPDFKKFWDEDYDIVPVIKKIPGDLDTPVSLLKKLKKKSNQVFLLESKEGPEKWARYSFLGFAPSAVLKGSNGKALLSENGQEYLEYSDPLILLKQMMEKRRSPRVQDLPAFIGGAVGYLGYENIRYFEPVHLDRRVELEVPEMLFFFTDLVVVVDHWEQSISLVKSVKREGEPEGQYRQALQELDSLASFLSQPPLDDGPGPQAAQAGKTEITANIPPERFREMVKEAKEYILSGDIFQVVLSRRFEVPLLVEPLEVYRSLRRINPSPYLYYIESEEGTIIGSSPEPLVKVTGDEVITRPIAGTRRRGHDQEEDRQMEQELLSDPKERAEHVMLVDLGRNDLGRVCVPGSVQVDEFIKVERYSHVMHLVSNVRGALAKDKDCYDALKSVFPAGTVSGAPKIRAMEIINELEECSRGPYAGAVLYFSDSGDLDSCITIRTIVIKDKTASVQTGAGIVADSDPELERKETENKARALLKAIEAANSGEF